MFSAKAQKDKKIKVMIRCDIYLLQLGFHPMAVMSKVQRHMNFFSFTDLLLRMKIGCNIKSGNARPEIK
jgi:hypothetical protein